MRQSEDGDGSGVGGGGGRVNGNDSTNNNMDVIFLGSNGNNNQKDVNREAIAPQSRFPSKYSSCKTLQRKLELKVERAKRNYSQQNRNEVITVCTAYIFGVMNCSNKLTEVESNGFHLPFVYSFSKDTKSNASLIPINRLPIPGHTLPLVEYKSDHR